MPSKKAMEKAVDGHGPKLFAVRELSFRVPGTPQGKGRPRFSSKSRTTYTPKETRAYETLVRTLALAAAMRCGWPIHCGEDVSLRIVATFPDRRRRDLDNVIKACADGLQPIAILDDSQIAEIHAYRVYGTDKDVGVKVTLRMSRILTKSRTGHRAFDKRGG